MPSFSRPCDLYQGFNFKKDKQSSVGYLLSIKIGEITLTADMTTIKDPENPAQDLSDKVVAVINHILWDTGVTDPIYISGNVSVQNRTEILTMTYNDLVNTLVEFKFCIYDFDPVQKKYFKALTSDAVLKGILEKNGDDLNLAVSEDPDTQVQSPLNYVFQIGIKPQPTEQTVNIATAVSKNVVKKWGTTNG